ncbi:CHAT domain-containing protein [Gautieria morchelliformis]|nr:CHAT domain-containing protein [Gautieria morchelliformis]
MLPTLHPDRSSLLGSLANALWTRFEYGGQHEYLEEAIEFHRKALDMRPAPHPDRSISLSNLGVMLCTEFEHFGRHEALEAAISSHREALKLRPAPHPDRDTSLNNLGIVLGTRFEQSGRPEDLDEAISVIQEALELRPTPHTLRASSLNNLAYVLETRFEQSGQQEDLEKAILFHREALELHPVPHPDRFTTLGNLASALMNRFEQAGRHEDLEEAISFHREALELQPALHTDRCMTLGNLGIALEVRFEQSGRHEDLEEAISFHREALEQRPAPHPDRPLSLTSLGSALRTRFKQAGQHQDLEEAISFHQEALELRPAPHPDRSMCFNNLGIVLETRFERSRQQEDLDKAISFNQEALKLRPVPHPDRSMSLNNLANVLETRFEQSGQQEDLEKAVLFHREALKLRPAPHPYRPTSLNNLANVLKRRFEQSGQQEDLEAAISFHREAQRVLHAGHPLTCLYSKNLGDTFMRAYTHTDKSEYFGPAMDVFRDAVACETAPASQRLDAAKLWARHADSKPDSALEAYQAAIELLPRLAMLGLDLSSRQQALTSGSDGLAREAAACAIRSGQCDKAVELLEEGRAVFWSQALQLRTPMDDLHESAPELEAKLRRISLALEQGSLRDVSQDISDSPQTVMAMEREAARLRRLNDEWLETLEKIRDLEAFKDFLRPQRLPKLVDAAAKAPVVILNASEAGCAALVLTLNGVQHVPLALSFADVNALVDLIQIATAPGHRDLARSASTRAHVDVLLQQMLPSTTLQFMRQSWESRDMSRVRINERPNDFQTVLAMLWQSVVKPVLCSLGLEISATPPNLCWCPTGPFAFLPIHAAGIYDVGEPECVCDHVVSSYTPTISALLSDSDMPNSDPFKMMVVIEPNTPGQSSLPYTVDEMLRIEKHVPMKDLITLRSSKVEAVVSHLPTTSIAHFACHGQQHPENPLESSLMLHDGPLKVSKIMQQPTPNAKLAFLGACQTATGDKTLPDEAIHLASTLLFAGFRGVVATMWSISDEDGPKIADAFYEYLYRENRPSVTDTFRPDTREAARALHVAVAKLRSEGVSFKRWVPFIHMGR